MVSLLGLLRTIGMTSKTRYNRRAKVIDSIISLEQSANIKGRQILDGVLIMNEVVNYYKKKNKQLMIYKIDFEKAYNSLSWEYITQIMSFLCFNGKWINWINSCLSSAEVSVLFNGSPSSEFKVSHGFLLLWRDFMQLQYNIMKISDKKYQVSKVKGLKMKICLSVPQRYAMGQRTSTSCIEKGLITNPRYGLMAIHESRGAKDIAYRDDVV